MSALLVAQLEVMDPKAFEAYRDKVPAVIERHGGRYLARGGAIEVLEGEWSLPRLVVIAFDSPDAAQRFYNSEDYQEILPLRLAASRGNVIIVEGI